MTVTVWIDGVLEPERVEGSLRDFAEALNLATAQGREYAILPGVGGRLWFRRGSFRPRARKTRK